MIRSVGPQLRTLPIWEGGSWEGAPRAVPLTQAGRGGIHAFVEKPGDSQHLSPRCQETQRGRGERDAGQVPESTSQGMLPTLVQCIFAGGLGSLSDGRGGLWNLAVDSWLNGDSTGSVHSNATVSAFKSCSASCCFCFPLFSFNCLNFYLEIAPQFSPCKPIALFT